MAQFLERCQLVKLLKKLLMIIVAALVVLVPLAITFTIGWRPILGPRSRPVTDRKFEATPARLERGRYVVNSVALCFECHSEHDASLPDVPVMAGREGSGFNFGKDPDLGSDFITRNITPDKETGIGSWTDDEIARAIREGIDRDGNMLFPAMPYGDFHSMSDEDVASVIVYLRSLPPIHNNPGKLRAPFPINRLVMSVPEPITSPVNDPDMSTPLARGTHIARLAHCAACHTPRDSRGQPMENLAFAGGSTFQAIAGGKPINSLNLTSDPSGIPYYDEAVFIKTIRTGQIGARHLNPIMPWKSFRNMTDEDLKSVWAFISSQKPVKHLVDNSVEATMCPLCGNKHGLGEKNK